EEALEERWVLEIALGWPGEPREVGEGLLAEDPVREAEALERAGAIVGIVEERGLDARAGARVGAVPDDWAVGARFADDGGDADEGRVEPGKRDDRRRLELHVVGVLAARRGVAPGALDDRVGAAGDAAAREEDDGRARVIDEARADGGDDRDRIDADALERGAGADARAKQDPGGGDRAGGEDDLFRRHELDAAVG